MKSAAQIGLVCFCLVPTVTLVAFAQRVRSFPIQPNAEVFVDAMDGFGPELQSALVAEGLSLIVVSDKRNAAFEISGTVRDTQELASADAMNVNQNSGVERQGDVQAKPSHLVTVRIVNLKTGELAWGYGLSGEADLHVAAESCAKQLKREMKRRH